EDAKAVRQIKKKIKIPIVCDIHFNYALALEAIKNGADKIRLNPGNIRKRDEIIQVLCAAKKAKIPIRVGLNSGSISTDMVRSALGYIKLFEQNDFHDIIISLKASDVVTTIEAYRRMAEISAYPLHLGVTASGSYDQGVVKSAIGIGALLLDGIGDTIRVSLTADPIEEVIAAKRILSAVGLRRFGPEVISCPTCGRCQVDLSAVVRELESKLHITQYTLHKSPFKIAVMGCEVNGPGEAKEADVGIAFGKGSGMLFKRGKTIKKVLVKDAVKELLAAIRNTQNAGRDYEMD
ncbi:MAG: (E)-4-hydroxy-3-methylbut-2-enyl-diphosphate synthase, partial [Candidatus Omnitrophota bacterium]|nr:(E)-4-hydroxy-3-methylbut-2-enyl-diphosphate synthase [Candidatus Omnitrophota bacterium]